MTGLRLCAQGNHINLGSYSYPLPNATRPGTVTASVCTCNCTGLMVPLNSSLYYLAVGGTTAALASLLQATQNLTVYAPDSAGECAVRSSEKNPMFAVAMHVRFMLVIEQVRDCPACCLITACACISWPLKICLMASPGVCSSAALLPVCQLFNHAHDCMQNAQIWRHLSQCRMPMPAWCPQATLVGW